jgi:small subunit ribosomal protein S6
MLQKRDRDDRGERGDRFDRPGGGDRFDRGGDRGPRRDRPRRDDEATETVSAEA